MLQTSAIAPAILPDRRTGIGSPGGGVTGTLAFLLALAGLSGLCLAMDRHHRDRFGRASGRARRRLMQGLGWAGLAGSAALSILAWGWAIGPVAWFALATPAGLAIVFALPWLPAARR